MATHTAQDFYGDTPPPRIMGTEMEYWYPAKDHGNLSQYLVKQVVERVGGNHAGGFLQNGGRAYCDVGHLEYATPECLGPIDQTVAEMAGQRIVRLIAQENHIDKPIYRRTGGHGSEGIKTVGYHQNFLTPQYKERLAKLSDARVIGAFIATRVVWAGVGRVDTKGYVVSQKAHDIRRETLNEDMTGVTEAGLWSIAGFGDRTGLLRKPLFGWSEINESALMESHSKYWERLEIRHADAPHSPWLRTVSMAATSLALRVLEHRSVFDKSVWQDLKISHLARTVQQVNKRPFHTTFQVESGKVSTAISMQRQFADMALRLHYDKDICLPADEVEAAQEWLAICDDLDRYDPEDITTLDIIRDRLDWAARLHMIHAYLDKKGVNSNISLNNSLAAAADISWDQIYPHSLADDYWKKKQYSFYDQYDDAISRRMFSPPGNTRAWRRAKELQAGATVYWGWGKSSAGSSIDLQDPYTS